jgi:hypothetical protein
VKKISLKAVMTTVFQLPRKGESEFFEQMQSVVRWVELVFLCLFIDEQKLCIVLSVNSIFPVVCWAGSAGAQRRRSPPSRRRD